MSKESQQAMTLPKAYENIGRVQVLCAVQSARGIDYAVEEQLCEAVRSAAATGAPVAVTTIAPGDPKVLSPEALTLIVHAGRDGDDMAVSIRPYRLSGRGDDILFGARPFVVPVGSPDRLAHAIGIALDELLPWRESDTGPKRIDR